MRIESHNERMRSSKAVSAHARCRTAAQRLMIDALPAVSGAKRAAVRSFAL
jgi:hypothetical protein